MSVQKKDEILLDSGTNELGILEFTLDGHSFGINVAKVRQLMAYDKVQPMPRSGPYIEGIIKPRDEIFTVVDLAGYLGLGSSTDTGHDILIIAYFNKINIAFHVHAVSRTYRISWGDIEKPSSTIYGGDDGVITGIAKFDGRMVSIIDFEKIIYDISPQTGLLPADSGALGARSHTDAPLLIAEDSHLLRKMLVDSLRQAGYTNITTTDNGQECWDLLEDFKKEPSLLFDHVACVITDIEMPKMDGHHLTRRIKSDPVLRNIPVIIFSSLIDDNMRLKGEEVGANAQLSKPEVDNLIAVIDGYIAARKNA